MASTFPQLPEMERKGGLIRSILKAPAPPKREGLTLFMTLRGGLAKLVEALAMKLPPNSVQTGVNVTALSRHGSQWRVTAGERTWMADAVVSAVGANVLASVINDFDFELSSVLREIPFSSTATVSMLFDESALKSPLDGFGFMVPRSQGKNTVAATYTSTKFPGRAAPGQALVRSFLGGAGREACVDADDAVVARQARGELKDILGLGEAHPKFSRVFRWIKANPQYNVGHGLRLRRIESCLQGHPGLVLAGCSYLGVGLPDCIKSGREAAAKALRAAATHSPAGVC
jgi:oxygen-dependent protoporphyrinogen oxidase